MLSKSAKLFEPKLWNHRNHRWCPDRWNLIWLYSSAKVVEAKNLTLRLVRAELPADATWSIRPPSLRHRLQPVSHYAIWTFDK